ncbi:DUF2997 domain-containing protein [Streptomyces sp. 8N616]|uniref:DUF2997 domain-containing protein n=1 Tax=Streptomyces sp. 8N616 TaxID=3457414 RepID=UPI003FD60F42
MKEQRIEVEIDRDGRITAEADGFSGDACLRDLEKLLDGLAEWESTQRKADTDERTVTRNRAARLGRTTEPGGGRTA